MHATTAAGQPGNPDTRREEPPEPSDRTPAWVRLLLTDREQALSPKLRWKVMLRSLDLDGPTKAVLLWLWERMYGPKVDAWPSQALLAEDSGYSVRTVKAALKQAERLDLITVTRRRRSDGRQATSRYTLAWPGKRPDGWG